MNLVFLNLLSDLQVEHFEGKTIGNKALIICLLIHVPVHFKSRISTIQFHLVIQLIFKQTMFMFRKFKEKKLPRYQSMNKAHKISHVICRNKKYFPVTAEILA
jgi:hypothetical protein